MQLWFVRHAIAADVSEEHPRDFDRPLTDKGRRKFQTLIQYLADSGLKPQVVLHSPLIRTTETAEILRKVVGLKSASVIEVPELSPGLDLAAVIHQVLPQYEHPIIALVGHEPDMSRCASLLMGGGHLNFGKGTIASLEFTDRPFIGGGVMSWMMRPSLVEAAS